ncbi:MAG TPA: winged helix-turn-helix domain-containing protein [Pyrinomonadaceae bacterium]|nr:winged helix-turn-helix domain-containing protein [Pyrinomonadaceae bacterium]
MSHSLKDKVSSATDDRAYEFGPFLIEPHARRLSRNGEAVALAAPEFELLLLLVRNHGRVVEKSEIMEAVWPNVEVEENNLTVRMSSLRRALGESKGHHPYIQTVTGRGYCLITQVNEFTAQPDTNGSIVDSESDSDPETNYEPAKDEQTVPAKPAIANRSSIWSSLVATRRKRLTLYALLLAVLTGAGVFFAVRTWRQSDASKATSQSMKMTRITHTGRVLSPAISPDGQTIAYVESDGVLNSLWLQRTGSNNPRQLLPPVKVSYQDSAFSRDGNTLYYSKCEPTCTLHKMPVLGGVETALAIRADSPVTFSPDGKRMAYLRVDRAGAGVQLNLLVANADGTREETLHSRTGDAMLYQRGDPAWSPDGKTIAFAIMNETPRIAMRVIGIDVANRKESDLTSRQWRYIQDVAWLPDGDGFIINARDESSTPEPALQIWRISYPGGEVRRITNDLNNYMRIGMAADSNTLMAVEMNWTSSVWLAPAENPSSAAQVTRGTNDRRDGHLGLFAAPDGRLIYVADYNGKRDLWSVNGDQTGHAQLTDGPHRDSNPTVTPDGRYIVFESLRDGGHSIWRVNADGRNHRRLTRGNYDAEPNCSPDGKWIVYVAYEDGRTVPKLRKTPIDGGSSVTLTNEYSVHPAISPDGKTIAYYRLDTEKAERRDIVIIPAEGGPPLKTLPAPDNFGGIMRWSPSGDALIYRDYARTGLWRFPLDGSQPSPVMNLRAELLFAFSYSHDGRWLAYASGSNASDVILITRFN